MSDSIDQRRGHWLDAYLVQAERDEQLSFLEIGCGDGLRLQKAGAHGAQCFAVEGDVRQQEEARQLCPDAFIVSAIDDIPPHAFDLILVSLLGDASILQTVLYKLAAKDSFKPTTTLVAMVRGAAEVSEAAAILSSLRFGKVEIAKTGPHRVEGHGSDFARFMQERYVPGTWSEIAAYEHLPRYQLACGMAQGARVLDFGCGSGYGAASLARVAANVIGLDISEDALTYARTTHRAANLEFVHEVAFGASLPSHGFDLITCFEVIEHLRAQNQDELLVALARLLAPRGRLLISTPNPHMTSLYGSNPYHLCELNRGEFAEKLRRHFSDLAILDQWVAASIVFQLEAAPKWAMLNDLTSDEVGSPAEPAVFVAVCGMEPVGELAAAAYLDRTRDFVRTRIQSLQWRNQQLIERYDLQQARGEVGRLNLLAQQLTTQLRGSTAELDAVLADRAALQATYAATKAALECSTAELDAVLADRAALQATYAATKAALERGTAELDAVLADRAALQATYAAAKASLEQSTAETGWVARERDEFRALTEALTATLADMELQVTAELAEVQARTAADLAQVQAQSAMDLAREQAAKADQHRQAGALAQELQALAAKLMLIEHSTSWRVAKRVMPLLRVVRPVLRRPAAALWRTVSRLRQGAARRSRPQSDRLPLLSSSQTEPEPEPRLPLRDLSFETSLDPVWDHVTHKYVLQHDPSFVPAAISHGLAKPYVVRPLTEIDLSIRRPKLLHVIPNVHVGGSTQLVIDLVQHLSGELEHEVLTSSLWRDDPHEGLTTHLVIDPDPIAMREVIDRVAPDLIHVHYWGLTDDPWYHSVLVSIKGRGIPTIQNINTPVAPLLDDIFQHYVFVSDYVRQEFGSSLPKGVTASVFHPGIELRWFEAVDPVTDREEAIGMVYRLEDDKLTEAAIDVFIEIVLRRPRTKVYIIGGGRFLEPYIARTEAANVRANFRFTGYVPYASLPSWYDKFSIFLAPVWKESFGQVAPFAMAKRQAVVGFKVGALPEILGSDATLGADVAETAAIAIALLDDCERLRQLGSHNARRALEMFDVNTMVCRYRNAYATLVDRARCPSPSPSEAVNSAAHEDAIASDTAATLINSRFPDLSALPVYVAPRGERRRVTVVTDSIGGGSLYGGVGTALILGALAARRVGAGLRLVTRNEFAQTASVVALLKVNGIQWDSNIESRYAPRASYLGGYDLPASEGDFFLTTSWWTTWATRQSVRDARIAYLVQEDERMFYPLGDEYLRCTETLSGRDLLHLVNSEILLEHFHNDGLMSGATAFEPSFPASLYHPPRHMQRQRGDKRRFFFYARPHNARNLYWRGIEAVAAAIEEGVFDPAEWDFYFAGHGSSRFSLPGGAYPIIPGVMAWADYAAFIRDMDIGLSLMYTPHPSYPPLDLAASGSVVVTNRFGLKRDLDVYSPNIICSDLDVPSLVAALQQAKTLAENSNLRIEHFNSSRLQRDWATSMAPALDRFVSWSEGNPTP